MGCWACRSERDCCAVRLRGQCHRVFHVVQSCRTGKWILLHTSTHESRLVCLLMDTRARTTRGLPLRLIDVSGAPGGLCGHDPPRELGMRRIHVPTFKTQLSMSQATRSQVREKHVFCEMLLTNFSSDQVHMRQCHPSESFSLSR